MIPGKLYKHTKKFNCYHANKYKNYILKPKYIFFYPDELFKIFSIDADDILYFVKLTVYIDNYIHANNGGIKYLFLHGKQLIEAYYMEANQMIIFEEVY